MTTINENQPVLPVESESESEEARQERMMQDALDLLKDYTIAKELTKTERLKAAVCGDRKSGKSNLVARTAKKPLLAYDFDDRRESIAGLDGVIIKTLTDPSTAHPRAWGQLEMDLGSLEYLKEKNQLPFKSISLDSMTYLRQFAENQMMKDTNSNLRKSTIGVQEYKIAQGWDSINYVQRMLDTLLRRFFSLGVDIYCVFHTKPEKDVARSTKDNTVYTDKLTVDPQNLNVLLSMFNEVWRTYLDESSNFKLQVKPDYYFPAATTLHNLNVVEDQDIQALLVKHNGAK